MPIRISVISPSEIARRRFMPALAGVETIQFAGVGVCAPKEREDFGSSAASDAEEKRNIQMQKASEMTAQYGGRIFSSYYEAVTAEDVDAVYLPLPPALHAKWAAIALEHGKHVLVEKPSTLSYMDSKKLAAVALKNQLALMENYMFLYHSQLDAIDRIIQSGELGEVRLMRISFGFPMRAKNDFRYNASAGGGALYDAGGYTIRCASRFLGSTASLRYAFMNRMDGFEVDMYGSGAMVNDLGLTAQLAFGMDNDYKCELEIWASKGTLYTNRILTAPDGYEPTLRISKNGSIQEITLPADNSFRNSILHFTECIRSEKIRQNTINDLLRQAEYMDAFRTLAASQNGE